MPDPEMIERAKRPDLRVGHGILPAQIGRLPGRYALVSQAEVLAQLDASISRRATLTLMAESLDEGVLERAAAGLPQVEHIVGIGGGTAMDMAKYLAWQRDLPLLLAPSIVSVDASVTNTVALRRDGHVVYEGFVIAEPIVADLELIAAAPPRLNRAGVGDLLSIQTGRFDWALGAEAGAIEFDADVDAAAGAVLERLYALADDVAAVTDRALEHIMAAYVEVNALLLTVGHSGPEEGSEHYFGYAVEAATGRSFVHGELIGLGTVLMAGLQDNGPARAAAFLDTCEVQWHPEQLGLERTVLAEVLVDLPAFVREASLPHSILDEVRLDAEAVSDLLQTIPTAGSTEAGWPGRQEGNPR